MYSRSLFGSSWWWSIDLILDRFSNLNYLSEASAQIFDFEVCARHWALILLRVIVIRINSLVIVECCYIIMVLILHLGLARGGWSRLLSDGGHRFKV